MSDNSKFAPRRNQPTRCNHSRPLTLFRPDLAWPSAPPSAPPEYQTLETALAQCAQCNRLDWRENMTKSAAGDFYCSDLSCQVPRAQRRRTCCCTIS